MNQRGALFVIISMNKIPVEQMHQFGHVFCKMLAFCTGSDRIEIGDLESKVKGTIT